jgi:hypothetical protein
VSSLIHYPPPSESHCSRLEWPLHAQLVGGFNFLPPPSPRARRSLRAMDPVSAIGVAAAAIAFLDFSLKTLSVCRELRDSGALPENLDIERRSKTLQRITRDLQVYVAQ